MAADVELQVGNRTVRISNPDRVYFPARGETKLDLARYYMSVGDGIVRALRERPCMLHRFPAGVTGEKVHQKRVPHGAPGWLETVRVEFPRFGRHAYELCVTELASVVWAVQMSTVEFHPWNSRRADTERPDEWRIDLDPGPRCPFGTVRRVARGVPEATVSTPITWDEIDEVDPRQFTIATVPARFAKLGDLHQGIDDSAYPVDTLLGWAERDKLD